MNALALSRVENAIGYDVASSAFGFILVAATERGVSAVQIGRDRQALIDLLEYRMSLKELAIEPVNLPYTRAVTSFLNGSIRQLDFPIDTNGTPFQKKVWEAIRAVPYGETITYQELARRIKHPDAVRAAANACGANKLALYYPCHRVIRSNGDLGGYFWGLDVKRKLLAMEKEGQVKH